MLNKKNIIIIILTVLIISGCTLLYVLSNDKNDLQTGFQIEIPQQYKISDSTINKIKKEINRKPRYQANPELKCNDINRIYQDNNNLIFAPYCFLERDELRASNFSEFKTQLVNGRKGKILIATKYIYNYDLESQQLKKVQPVYNYTKWAYYKDYYLYINLEEEVVLYNDTNNQLVKLFPVDCGDGNRDSYCYPFDFVVIDNNVYYLKDYKQRGQQYINYQEIRKFNLDTKQDILIYSNQDELSDKIMWSLLDGDNNIEVYISGLLRNGELENIFHVYNLDEKNQTLEFIREYKSPIDDIFGGDIYASDGYAQAMTHDIFPTNELISILSKIPYEKWGFEWGQWDIPNYLDTDAEISKILNELF